MTADKLIEFERSIADEWNTGKLPFLIHLNGGNERQLIDIFKEIEPGDWVVSTHRNHYHYLLTGGSPARLRSEIRAGRSMFIYDKALNFVTSSIVAGNCAIAAGLAWACKEKGKGKVWCFVGDGAEDNGHFYEAVLFVEGRGLPCTFIVEDNNRSVDATKAQRRGADAPIINAKCVRRYSYTPTYPHAGSGTKERIVFTTSGIFTKC